MLSYRGLLCWTRVESSWELNFKDGSAATTRNNLLCGNENVRLCHEKEFKVSADWSRFLQACWLHIVWQEGHQRAMWSQHCFLVLMLWFKTGVWDLVVCKYKMWCDGKVKCFLIQTSSNHGHEYADWRYLSRCLERHLRVYELFRQWY